MKGTTIYNLGKLNKDYVIKPVLWIRIGGFKADPDPGSQTHTVQDPS
jgi:hypothetical protein